jgi:hypothetical protein
MRAPLLCSLFTDALSPHMTWALLLDIAISVGVQQMVRSDKASSGVAFTIDPDSGLKTQSSSTDVKLAKISFRYNHTR